MSSSSKLVLYTQPRCEYCDMMKDLLDQTEYTYEAIDISQDPSAKDFIKAEGHKTVPQLYWDRTKINNVPTDRMSVNYIVNSIKLLEDIQQEAEKWPWEDSGIEQGNV